MPPQTAEKFLPGKFSRSGFIAFGLTTGFCLFMGGELLAAVAAAAAAGLCLAGTHQAKHIKTPPLATITGILSDSPRSGSGIGHLAGPPLATQPLALCPAAGTVRHGAGLPGSHCYCHLHFPGAGRNPVGDSLPDRHQMMTALVLTTLLGGAILVFMREYKSRQLAPPLRRTDELTQAASREYLSADLHKEIQRSEREGTNMSVMMIGLDTHLSDVDPDEDIRAILPRIGRYLHSQLRDFDTYYRVADLQFLVILPPGANTAEEPALQNRFAAACAR